VESPPPIPLGFQFLPILAFNSPPLTQLWPLLAPLLLPQVPGNELNGDVELRKEPLEGLGDVEFEGYEPKDAFKDRLKDELDALESEDEPNSVNPDFNRGRDSQHHYEPSS